MSQIVFNDANIDGAIEPDNFLDEGFAESINTDYATSIASEIRRGIEENGRTYPSFGKNEYGLPIDEQGKSMEGDESCSRGRCCEVSSDSSCSTPHLNDMKGHIPSLHRLMHIVISFEGDAC